MGRSPGRRALLALLLYVVIDVVYFSVGPLAHLGRTCACGAGSDPPLFASDRYAAVVPPGSTVLALPFAMHGSSMLWQAEYRFRFRMADSYVGALAPADYARDIGTPPLTDPLVRPTPAALRRFLVDRHVEMVLIDAAEAGYWPQLMASTGVQPGKIGGVLVYRIDA